MKILTISIAAYNVGKYLSKTLDMLADKRLAKYIEVLIIDDGSKDDTGKISKVYAEKFPNVFKYVGKENGGHGSTINKGMELASGKYFRVLDGDDSLDVENLLILLKRMEEFNDDMFVSDFRAITSEGERYIDPYVVRKGKNIFESLEDNAVYTLDDNLKYMELIGLSTLAIKTELLHKYAFAITEHCYYVDVEFVVWCMALAREYRYFSKPVYLYLKDRNTENSVSKANMIKNIQMQEKVSYRLLAIYNELNERGRLKNKRNIISKRIISVLSATMRTYLLMKDSRNKIMSFENKIQLQSNEIYNDMYKDKFNYLLRMRKYAFVSFIAFFYHCYVKYKY